MTTLFVETTATATAIAAAAAAESEASASKDDVRPPAAAADYEDDGLTIHDNFLKIRWYYFPFGTKTVELSAIAKVTRHPMTGLLSGRGRVWGTGDLTFRHWLNLDAKRSSKQFLYEVQLKAKGKKEKNQYVCPTVTPEDPKKFEDAIRQAGIEIDKSESEIVV